MNQAFAGCCGTRFIMMSNPSINFLTKELVVGCNSTTIIESKKVDSSKTVCMVFKAKSDLLLMFLDMIKDEKYIKLVNGTICLIFISSLVLVNLNLKKIRNQKNIILEEELAKEYVKHIIANVIESFYNEHLTGPFKGTRRIDPDKLYVGTLAFRDKVLGQYLLKDEIEKIGFTIEEPLSLNHYTTKYIYVVHITGGKLLDYLNAQKGKSSAK